MTGMRGLALAAAGVVMVGVAFTAGQRPDAGTPDPGAVATYVGILEAGAVGDHAMAADVMESFAPQQYKEYNPGYDGRLQFVRIQYTPANRGGFGFRRGGREPMWAHDYPRAERNFMRIIQETTFVDPVVDGSNILTLDDPDLFKYPLAYIVEVGAWEPTDEEASNLGQYLLKGGFLIVDDFRGQWELANLEVQLQRAIPSVTLQQLDESHPIFDSFFRIDPDAVIPPYGRDLPLYFGIYEDNDPDGRLLAVVNYNNDIAEYWEFSDRGYYPIDLSNEAYKLGVNYIVYALTH